MKKKTEFSGIRLWRYNRKDQEHFINANDLTVKFDAWLSAKENSFIEYYPVSKHVRNFLTSKEEHGCSSSFEEKDINDCIEFLRPVVYSRLNIIDI